MLRALEHLFEEQIKRLTVLHPTAIFTQYNNAAPDVKSIFTSFQRYTCTSIAFDVWCIACIKSEDPIHTTWCTYTNRRVHAAAEKRLFLLGDSIASSSPRCFMTIKKFCCDVKNEFPKSHNAQKANKDKYTNTEMARLRCHPTLLSTSLSLSRWNIFSISSEPLRVSFDRKILPQLHNARGIIFLRVDELAVNRRKILYVRLQRRESRHISLES